MSAGKLDSAWPRAVLAEIPAGAMPGFHLKGVPALAMGSQVAISRAFAACASSCVWALQICDPGVVSTWPVTGSIFQALRLPVQSWKVSEVLNCARYATDPFCRPPEFTATAAVDCVVARICARIVCRSLVSVAGSVAAK